MYVSSKAEREPLTTRIVWGLFLVFIVLSPFPLGGNRPLAWGLYALFAGTLLILSAFLKPTAKLKASGLKYPAILFGATCLWVIIQVMPLPDIGVMRYIPHPAWTEARDLLGIPLSPRISLDPSATYIALMRWMTYATIFYLALIWGRDAKKAFQLVFALSMAGCIYAVYAINAYEWGNTHVLWYPRTSYMTSLTGTFINRNSAASFFGLIMLTTCVLIWHYVFYALRHNTHLRPLERWIRFVTSPYAYVMFVLLLPLSALVLTKSRAGIAFGLGAAVLLMILLIITLRTAKMTLPKSQRRLIFLGVGAFALLMGIVVILGSAGLAERLHTEGLALHHRWIMYQLALQAFWDRPWQGTGLGTFSHIIAMYRQENLPIWSIWDKAHNTYLELLVELGWPATMALIGSMVWIISQCMRGIVIRRRNGMYPALAVAASAMLGLHALLDFSLQISGVTIPYLALLGVGYAQAFSSTDKRFSDSTTQSRAVDPLRKHHSIDAIYQKPPA